MKGKLDSVSDPDMPTCYGMFLLCPPRINESCRVVKECRVNPVISMDVLLDGAEADTFGTELL